MGSLLFEQLQQVTELGLLDPLGQARHLGVVPRLLRRLELGLQPVDLLVDLRHLYR